MLHRSNPRDALAWVMQDIHAKGWCRGTGGNFSVVLEAEPLRLLMAPSGVDKGLVAPDDLIEVDARGEVLAGGGKASAETALHLRIIARCGAGSVLHTHSIFNTLLSELFLPERGLELHGYEMLKGLEGIRTHDTSVTVPILPNSQDLEALSDEAEPLLAEAPYGLLIAGHGLYAWGADLFQARRHLEILEFLLELTYRRLLLERN